MRDGGDPVMNNQFYLIKTVSEQLVIPIGTLLYYDKINLVKPNKRSGNGYRLYSQQDCSVLRLILLLKRLGFKLQRIKQLLQQNTVHTLGYLETRAKELESQIARTQVAHSVLISATIEYTKQEPVAWQG